MFNNQGQSINKQDSQSLPQKHIQVWMITIGWVVYGQALAFFMSHGYLVDVGQIVFDGFGKFIPSISRIASNPNLDVTLAQSLASLLLLSIPILFVAFLFCDFEGGVVGVREKGKEVLAVLLLTAIGSGVFVAGFNHSIAKNGFVAFSLLSTLITYLSAYCYRVAFCIATKI